MSNFNEIIKKLKESSITIKNFAFEDFNEEDLKNNDIPLWEEVEQYGGEGKGDVWYSIKYFKDLDLYIKVSGYYQSYNGTEFFGDYKDCCTEVRPVSKNIIFYE